jgi:protein CMS1
MGDAIESDVWEGENEIDLAQNYKSDEEFEDQDSGSDNDVSAPVPNEKLNKKRKKFEAMKLKKKLKLESGDIQDTTENIGDTKTQLVAKTPEEMLQLVEIHKPRNISSSDGVELSIIDFCEVSLPESATTKSEKNKAVCPFVRALSVNMPSYKKLLLNNSGKKDDFGCPLLLILCSSAIRATQIIKSMSAKLIKCKIAKLFAKHFKVEEQMEMLSKGSYNVALGTPNRVKRLIEVGALSLRRVSLVLVDVLPDAKTFNILTLNEVKDDFYKLLYHHILPEKAHLKLALIN